MTYLHIFSCFNIFVYYAIIYLNNTNGHNYELIH